jgi:hypothetical protein
MGSQWPARAGFGEVPVGACSFGCADRSSADDFDALLRAETNFPVSFDALVSSHLGWYYEETKEADTDLLRAIEVAGGGVYILWKYVDFCDVHKKEVQEAQYVGKAGRSVLTRLIHAYKTRGLGGDSIIEITAWLGPNRQAKYLEQLLLDSFAFSANKSENSGTRTLRAPVGPGEWD